MFKLTSNVFGVLSNEKQYLTLLVGILIALPIAYLGYLSMNAYIIGVSIPTILKNSNTESINLIANLTSVYSAYVILQFRNNLNKKKGFIAFGIIFISQLFLMNQIMIAAMFYYVMHFVGFRKFKNYYITLEKSNHVAIILYSLLTLFISIIIFVIKLKVGLV